MVFAVETIAEDDEPEAGTDVAALTYTCNAYLLEMAARAHVPHLAVQAVWLWLARGDVAMAMKQFQLNTFRRRRRRLVGGNSSGGGSRPLCEGSVYAAAWAATLLYEESDGDDEDTILARRALCAQRRRNLGGLHPSRAEQAGEAFPRSPCADS